MGLPKEELDRMAQADLREADLDSLVDISKIEVDRNKLASARVEDFAQEVGNPYLVRVGDYAVKVGYSDCQETLNDRMEEYIRKVAEIKY